MNERDNKRVAIVTGGASGIGWATAQRFAADGLRVAIVDLDAEAASARAEELGAGGHLGIEADMASEEQVVAFMLSVHARCGRLDVLVNNAGIGEQAQPTVNQSVAAFDRLLAIHLRGTFLASREAARVCSNSVRARSSTCARSRRLLASRRATLMEPRRRASPR